MARQVSIKTKYKLRVAEDEKALLVDRLGSEVVWAVKALVVAATKWLLEPTPTSRLGIDET